MALRAVAHGRAVPAFQSALLPDALHQHVAARLAGVQNKSAVRAIFAEARLAEQPHNHQFIEHRCMVCGCGEPTNDHGMAYPVATDPDPTPGAMVALFIPASVGQQILLPGGEPLEDLHVTLAYLGDLADLSPQQQDTLRDAAAAYASRCQPLVGEIGGIGRFAAPEGEQTPVYANVDVPALPTFRQELLTALDVAGIPVVQNHGFTPHCTLAYVPPDATLALRPTPLTPVTFAYLWVALGAARYAYPLGEKKTDDAERRAVVETLRELKTLTVQALTQDYTGTPTGTVLRWSPYAWMNQPRNHGKFAATDHETNQSDDPYVRAGHPTDIHRFDLRTTALEDVQVIRELADMVHARNHPEDGPAGTTHTSSAAYMDGTKDTRAEAFARQFGLDALPHSVSKDEMAGYLKSGERELWRGDATPAFAQQFAHGAWHIGLSLYCNGTYFAYGKRGVQNASYYAQRSGRDAVATPGVLRRYSLKADAHVIDIAELRELRSRFFQRCDTEIAKAKAAGNERQAELWAGTQDFIREDGRAAMFFGYDAVTSYINLGDPEGVDARNLEMIVVNRSALRVQETY